jgi:coenzyme F420-reducing hydrogenase delta subunit/NAD-dependent dihydropyrimidine dehydrogenase PreA subunit
MGVFICNCDHLISDIIDTEALCEQAATWPNVAHAQVLPFSCTPDARQTIQNKVRQLDLNRITLGACACCSLDQVCYSCTYQRIRCKANLGLFHSFQGNPQHQDASSAGDLPPSAVEFVNIREQCAWVHRNNPRAATAKAMAMVAAAAAKNRSADDKLLECLPAEHSVLIFGSGRAARTCRDLLRQQDITVHDLAEPPSHIRRVQGCYSITQYGQNWRAAGMVLAPGDATEADKIMGAFGDPPYRPRFRSFQRDRLETTRPGVFYCDPALEGTTVGAAATARVSAWLGQSFKTPGPHTAVVDPHRCRACHTCVEICEFGAPRVMGTEPDRFCWIDPRVCEGCGSCAAQCPSGAIAAGYATDKQLEVMLDAIWDQVDRSADKQMVLVFTCNWNPYSGMEAAAVEQLTYSADIYPLRVMCLGRLRPGIILKAFERGAHGVLLLGCPQDECRYEFGGRRSEEAFAVAKEMVRTLGYPDPWFKLDRVAAGDGKAWVNKVQAFIAGLNGKQA